MFSRYSYKNNNFLNTKQQTASTFSSSYINVINSIQLMHTFRLISHKITPPHPLYPAPSSTGKLTFFNPINEQRLSTSLADWKSLIYQCASALGEHENF